MCYFLYGAVNEGINTNDYHNTIQHYEYHFNPGNMDAVNHCVENCGDHYRITAKHCDCGTPIGQKDANNPQLKELAELLYKLRDVRGIKFVLISKNWWKETNRKQNTVHIDDIDLLPFLANMEENCMYRIDLFQKFY
ncbi:MAG: hypothetical protein PUC06_01395 [Oscillospiraceae bacterium]|nr:hypothetical protein [Oscillospiraceae bacterium]